MSAGRSQPRATSDARSPRPAVGEPVDPPPSTAGGRASLTALLASPLGRQLLSFGVIGVASTVAWAVLYLALRRWLGPVGANGVALVLTTIGNTAANRRLTFGIQGRNGLLRDHGAGLVAFGFALAITTGAAALLGAVAPHASRLVELTVLIGANAVATLGRFALLRAWVGRRTYATG
jgi:putative flippase GtrA